MLRFFFDIFEMKRNPSPVVRAEKETLHELRRGAASDQDGGAGERGKLQTVSMEIT